MKYFTRPKDGTVKVVELKCDTCERTFWEAVWSIKDNKGKHYCNRACYSKDKRVTKAQRRKECGYAALLAKAVKRETDTAYKIANTVFKRNKNYIFESDIYTVLPTYMPEMSEMSEMEDSLSTV